MTRLATSLGSARVALVLAACGGSSAAVIDRVDPASAVECPYGGRIVSSGVDLDGDGALQDAEIGIRTPVCDPPPAGSAIVVRVAFEPPGAHCPGGGTAVQAGPDSNGNGALDDAEVAHTDYLCRDALVTRLASEPAGPNCLEGGVAFLVGVDRDGDGELDPAELEHTEYACGDVVTRDVVIHDDAEAAALAPIRVITGGLTVRLAALRRLTLPALERIDGSLQVTDNPQLTQLVLPALQAVAGDVVLRADGLTGVAFAQLARVGSLELELLALRDLSGFPALTESAGPVRIHNLPRLVSAALPQASHVGDVTITANARLVHVAWDVTDQIGAIDIHDNPLLETVDLSVNTFFGGPVHVGPVAVTANPRLGHLALTARTVASFTIGGEPVLTDLALPMERFEGDVAIVGVTSPLDLMMRGHFGSMTVDGDLTISAPVATYEAGSSLFVQGRYTLDGTRLQHVGRFDGSLDVHSLRVSNNTRLTDLTAFALRGDLEVRNNAALATVDLELPDRSVGAVVITDNPVLASAPGLAFAAVVRGAVDLERNPQLAAVFGPELERIEGPARVHDNAALAAWQLPVLRFVGGALEVSTNAALQRVALPALLAVPGALTIADNPQLHELDLAALGHSDNFRVVDNPRLPTCAVLAIFGHTTGAHEQSGNDDAARCEP